MQDLLISLKSLLKTNYVIIDNNICRLHYKATFGFLLAFCILVTAKQYVGDPIDCVVPKDVIDTNLLDTYCWIHKTFSVERAFTGDKDEVAYPGVSAHKPGDKLIYHSYYQWVCFVLFIQAMVFYLPRFIWKIIEGQRIQHLTSDLSNPIISYEKCDPQINLVVSYLEVNRGQHKLYFAGLIFVEILNFLNVIAQMFLMDKFLGGEFSTYGWKVLTFTEWHWERRFDPMVRVFPRMAKCMFRMFGSSGSVQSLDAVCVLPINIINEKIYVFIWFWFIFIAVVSGLFLIYRAATLMVPNMRLSLMKWKLGATDDRHDIILEKMLTSDKYRIDAGDWLLLYQINKNVDRLHMMRIIELFSAKLGIPEAQKLIESKGV